MIDLLHKVQKKDAYDGDLLEQLTKVKHYLSGAKSITQALPYQLSSEQTNQLETNILRINASQTLISSPQLPDKTWYKKHGTNVECFDKHIAKEAS
jgi:hypothetical protein